MNLLIDRLCLRLPHGFEPRAAALARELAAALARQELGPAGTLERIALPAVRLDPAGSNTQLAARLAEHVAQAVRTARS
ncbi:MAG: hypothetical protein U1F76_31320 [Candidatus Competibacteraceae bacterium]